MMLSGSKEGAQKQDVYPNFLHNIFFTPTYLI